MNKYLIPIIIIVVVAFLFYYFIPRTGSSTCAILDNSAITVNAPCMNASVGSTININGEVVGNYTFEATFRVSLLDQTGNIVLTQPANVTGDWMTTNKLPFSLSLNHSLTAQNATILFENDNPSALEQNSRKIYLPIKIN